MVYLKTLVSVLAVQNSTAQLLEPLFTSQALPSQANHGQPAAESLVKVVTPRGVPAKNPDGSFYPCKKGDHGCHDETPQQPKCMGKNCKQPSKDTKGKDTKGKGPETNPDGSFYPCKKGDHDCHDELPPEPKCTGKNCKQPSEDPKGKGPEKNTPQKPCTGKNCPDNPPSISPVDVPDPAKALENFKAAAKIAADLGQKNTLTDEVIRTTFERLEDVYYSSLKDIVKHKGLTAETAKILASVSNQSKLPTSELPNLGKDGKWPIDMVMERMRYQLPSEAGKDIFNWKSSDKNSMTTSDGKKISFKDLQKKHLTDMDIAKADLAMYAVSSKLTAGASVSPAAQQIMNLAAHPDVFKHLYTAPAPARNSPAPDGLTHLSDMVKTGVSKTDWYKDAEHATEAHTRLAMTMGTDLYKQVVSLPKVPSKSELLKQLPSLWKVFEPLEKATWLISNVVDLVATGASNVADYYTLMGLTAPQWAWAGLSLAAIFIIGAGGSVIASIIMSVKNHFDAKKQKLEKCKKGECKAVTDHTYKEPKDLKIVSSSSTSSKHSSTTSKSSSTLKTVKTTTTSTSGRKGATTAKSTTTAESTSKTAAGKKGGSSAKSTTSSTKTTGKTIDKSTSTTSTSATSAHSSGKPGKGKPSSSVSSAVTSSTTSTEKSSKGKDGKNTSTTSTTLSMSSGKPGKGKPSATSSTTVISATVSTSTSGKGKGGKSSSTTSVKSSGKPGAGKPSTTVTTLPSSPTASTSTSGKGKDGKHSPTTSAKSSGKPGKGTQTATSSTTVFPAETLTSTSGKEKGGKNASTASAKSSGKSAATASSTISPSASPTKGEGGKTLSTASAKSSGKPSAAASTLASSLAASTATSSKGKDGKHSPTTSVKSSGESTTSAPIIVGVMNSASESSSTTSTSKSLSKDAGKHSSTSVSSITASCAIEDSTVSVTEFEKLSSGKHSSATSAKSSRKTNAAEISKYFSEKASTINPQSTDSVTIFGSFQSTTASSTVPTIPSQTIQSSGGKNTKSSPAKTPSQTFESSTLASTTRANEGEESEISSTSAQAETISASASTALTFTETSEGPTTHTHTPTPTPTTSDETQYLSTLLTLTTETASEPSVIVGQIGVPSGLVWVSGVGGYNRTGFNGTGFNSTHALNGTGMVTGSGVARATGLGKGFRLW